MTTATLPEPVANELLTIDEFLAKHGDERGVELVNGRVVRCSVPTFDHGVVVSNFGFFLKLYLRQHQLGRIASNDSFLKISDDPPTLRGPDLQYVSYERVPKGEKIGSYSRGGVDLVFEVKSPSDRWPELLIKVSDYLKAGVTVVIVVDPDSATVMVYRPDHTPQTFSLDTTLEIPDLLPGFSVPVKELFVDA